MPIEHIDDWDRRIARQDAFWHCAVMDRPVVSMTYASERIAHAPRPSMTYAAQRERWFDTERVVDEALAAAANRVYAGDALPQAWPNLGPEVFTALLGQELTFTADSSWSEPLIGDWSEWNGIRLSRENVYWRKLDEMTDALLEAGKGLFYTGLTDFHPGGDAIAALRDPARLNEDLLLEPDAVRAALEDVQQAFFETFDYFHGKLRAAGQAVSSWPGIVSSKTWYVPSNDFSCMISREMFDEFFLPGIREECRRLEASIYHLDGPGALRHLDALLDIPELNAIQWIYGAGNGRASDWLDVYKRCQSAGKGLQIHLEPDELEVFMEQLRPEGLWLSVAVNNADEADAVLRRIMSWK